MRTKLVAILLFLGFSPYLWIAKIHAQESEGVPYRTFSLSEMEIARSDAENLAKKIDETVFSPGRLANLYKESGTALKTRYSDAAFASRIMSVRVPLGAVQSREFSGMFGPYHTLPNVIGGDYVIIVFNSRFGAQTNSYTEQITLENGRTEGTGWTLVEYFVAPVAHKT